MHRQPAQGQRNRHNEDDEAQLQQRPALRGHWRAAGQFHPHKRWFSRAVTTSNSRKALLQRLLFVMLADCVGFEGTSNAIQNIAIELLNT